MRHRGLGSVLALTALVCAAVASATSVVSLAKPKCVGKTATIVGTARGETRDGTVRADVIAGQGGRDYLDGKAGDDRICGGPGDDVLTGSAGRDSLDGGPGFDVCRSAERRIGCEETRPAPRRGVLLPGEYFYDVFALPFSFAIVEPGWSVSGQPTFRQLLMGTRFDPGGTTVTIDSRGEGRSVSDTIARLASLEGTTAGPVQAVTIGGAPGRRVSVTVSAEDLVLVPGFIDQYELEATDRAQFTALDVNGKTMTIAVEAPDDQFDAWAAEAGKLLDSIRFRSS